MKTSPESVISPSTASRDRVGKFDAYLNAGVREYWLVDPETKTVQVCVLHSGFYSVTIHKAHETVPVLKGCVINFQDVFSS